MLSTRKLAGYGRVESSIGEYNSGARLCKYRSASDVVFRKCWAVTLFGSVHMEDCLHGDDQRVKHGAKACFSSNAQNISTDFRERDRKIRVARIRRKAYRDKTRSCRVVFMKNLKSVSQWTRSLADET